MTNTTTTTVVHTPYPQPQPVAPSYPGPTYQGYHPMPPQPGMPAAPYPTQYPPPYLAQPTGPPAYHESLAGKYHCGFSNPVWSRLMPLLLGSFPPSLPDRLPCSPVSPQLTYVLSPFRSQPASIQPSLHGSPKGLSLPPASLAAI